MDCYICGETIEGYGNNPWPLCSKKDDESLCCDNCNSQYVILARQAIHDFSCANTYEALSPWNSMIAILWSGQSELPLKTFVKTHKILVGQLTEIDGDLLYGKWGDFPISIKNDQWYVINPKKL